MKLIPSALKKSLSARLLAFFALLCLCVLIIIAIAFAKGFGSQWQDGVKPHLNQYLSYINADIGNPPDLERAKALAQQLPVNIYIEGPELNFSSSGKLLDHSQLEFHEHTRRWGKYRGDSVLNDNASLSFGELSDRTVLRNDLGDYQIYYEVEHGDPEARRSAAMHFAIIGLLVLFALSYLALRHMLRPVRDIQQGVIRMGDGALDYRVPVRAENDLGELATSINQMAGDIENMLDAKRELLLAVSHELRSPLTRAKLAVQMLDESRNQASLAEDIEEMQQLISELLEAERLNGRHSALNLAPCNIAQLVEAVTAEYPADTLQLETDELSSANVDDVRLKLALRNLINNALTHSQNAEAKPIVRAQMHNKQLSISVQDFGAGIAADEIHRISEAFYRADASRTRGTGGFGLGLYLCQQICKAHGGSLEIESELEKGSTMRILIPLE